MSDINLGYSLYADGDYAGAESAYLSAVRADPANFGAIFGLGLTALARRNFSAGAICFRRAADLEPSDAGAICNLGISLAMLDRLDEAESVLREAIRIDPQLGAAHHMLGAARYWLGDDVGAEACFRTALGIRPEEHDWHGSLGHCLLRQGDLIRGTESYRWVFASGGPLAGHRAFSHPLWDGSPLDGKTILLHDHQGMGDLIQLVRFASHPALSGGRVIVECHRQLMRFVATCHGVDRAIARDDPLPDFDVHSPLLALLGTLGTTIDTIPAKIPYLSPDPDRFAHWASRLDEVSRGFRMGIHWQGDPIHSRDRHRSFPIAYLSPLAKVPGVTLVSLQRGLGAEQLRGRSFPAVDFGDDVDAGLETFDDTPALIANLDLVISADTCIVHTAGALGVPVWIALPYSPDWRWFRDRSDSPWYPTARLFRQSKPGDWSGVFEEIVEAIRELLR